MTATGMAPVNYGSEEARLVGEALDRVAEARFRKYRRLVGGPQEPSEHEIRELIQARLRTLDWSRAARPLTEENVEQKATAHYHAGLAEAFRYLAATVELEYERPPIGFSGDRALAAEWLQEQSRKERQRAFEAGLFAV